MRLKFEISFCLTYWVLDLNKLPHKFKMAAFILSGLVSNKTGCWRLSRAQTHGLPIPYREGWFRAAVQTVIQLTFSYRSRKAITIIAENIIFQLVQLMVAYISFKIKIFVSYNCPHAVKYSRSLLLEIQRYRVFIKLHYPGLAFRTEYICLKPLQKSRKLSYFRWFSGCSLI